jgi:ZIP family zinc transporter
MSTRRSSVHHDYELLPRASIDSDGTSELPRQPAHTSWLGRIAGALPFGVRQISNPKTYTHYITVRRRKRSLLRLVYHGFLAIPFVCFFLVLFVSIIFPSYTYPPAHYEELRQRALGSSLPGRANTRNEKVFIAASLYEKEGELTSGPWGQSVLDLVDLLGPQNVYLSVYENNPDDLTRKSLEEFKRKAPCTSVHFLSPARN